METVAGKTDRRYVFVDMEDIRTRADTHGRYNHPNDRGMALIAERFRRDLAPYFPSPARKQAAHVEKTVYSCQ